MRACRNAILTTEVTKWRLVIAVTKLYQVPIGEVNKLADSKYGVTYFGPDGGEYLIQHHGSYRFLKFRSPQSQRGM
jgi:hypothetical protein